MCLGVFETVRYIGTCESCLMRALLLLGLTFTVASTGRAQQVGKLAGQVFDPQGQPAPGATVYIEGTQLGTATDIEGKYFIQGVPYGSYDVQLEYLSRDGRHHQVQGPVQIQSPRFVELDFELGDPVQEDWSEWERPIVISCGIGVPKVVWGEDIERLPVGGVVTDSTALERSSAASAYSRRKQERFGSGVE